QELGDLLADCRFEQALGGIHIVARVFGEATAPAGADARLGGEVEDDVPGPEYLGQVELVQVTGQELEAGMPAGGGDVGALQAGAVIRCEGVDSDHRVTSCQQRLCQLGTYEPGGA